MSQSPRIVGIKSLLASLKTAATYNRTNEFFVIGEFRQNKFDPLSSDFHIRGIYSTNESRKKLIYPKNLSKVCYKFTNELQEKDFKVYYFKASPLELTFQEELMDKVSRELATGQYGDYFVYKWNDVSEEAELKELGNIKI